MFLEYWMIGVFVAAVCYMMFKSYRDGVTKGILISADIILETLQNKKIISIVTDENGEDKIVPGDLDAFIKKSEKAEP